MKDQEGRAPRLGPYGDPRSRLVELRQYFRLSQSQLGVWLNGYSQANVSQWETGHRPMPYAEVARRFGVSVDWLMGISPRMWGFPVTELRELISQHLGNIPEEEKRRLSSPLMEPSDRISFMVDLCRKHNPDLLSDHYLAAVMGLELDTLRRLLTGRLHAERLTYERFACFVGLPAAWFECGDLPVSEGTGVDAYRQAVAQAIAKKVSPQRLSQLLLLITEPES